MNDLDPDQQTACAELLRAIHAAADVARRAVGESIVTPEELSARLLREDLRPRRLIDYLQCIAFESERRIPAVFLREREVPPKGTTAEIRGGRETGRRDVYAYVFNRITAIGVDQVTWRPAPRRQPELFLVYPDGTEVSLGLIPGAK